MEDDLTAWVCRIGLLELSYQGEQAGASNGPGEAVGMRSCAWLDIENVFFQTH